DLANSRGVPDTDEEICKEGQVRRNLRRNVSRRLWLGLVLMISACAGVSGQSASPQKRFAEGQGALERGDLDVAEKDFKAVLAADPKAGPAYTNLGVIAMRRKNWDEAVRLLEKAERLQPGEPGIRLNLGLVEYKRGNYPDAIAP